MNTLIDAMRRLGDSEIRWSSASDSSYPWVSDIFDTDRTVDYDRTNYWGTWYSYEKWIEK